MCVCVLVRVLWYSTRDAGGSGVAVIAHVVIAAVVVHSVDVARLRHGLLLYQTHRSPSSTSIFCLLLTIAYNK